MRERTEADAESLGDRALVAALRCGSSNALREFVLRFRPMLVQASRRLGAVSPDGEDVADEVLHDAALRLGDAAAPVPVAVRGYLLRSLHNRLANVRRSRERRLHATTTATDVACAEEPYFEHAVVGCASEYSVQASHGPANDGPQRVSPALARLARELTSELRVEDRLLVEWLSDHVPQQEIAAWLGLGYDATSKRVRRLRARLQAAAMRYVERLSPAERRHVLSFLRRAGHSVVDDDAATPHRIPPLDASMRQRG